MNDLAVTLRPRRQQPLGWGWLRLARASRSTWARRSMAWVVAVTVGWTLCVVAVAGDQPQAGAAGEARDWDAITTRAAAASGRLDDYFFQLLDIAQRHAGRPIAETALGVAEHLTRDSAIPIDYHAAMLQLAQFDSVDATDERAAASGVPPRSRLGIVGWYLLERLRARCYHRAGRIADARVAAGAWQNSDIADAWWVVGPFGRSTAWAFDTAYPPEIDALHSELLSHAGADYHWHPLPLDDESGSMCPAAALEPAEGVGYLRSPRFSLLASDHAVETVQLLVWSTGPWQLQIIGGNAHGAPLLTHDPGGVAGANLRLFEIQLAKDHSYRLLAKVPAGCRDFNVVFLDPRTRRPPNNLHAVLEPGAGENPAIRELPLSGDLLSQVARPGAAPGTPPPERTQLTGGEALRSAVAAYSCGAYDQARYYLQPVAHQSAAAEYWLALCHLDADNPLLPTMPEEPLALIKGAARRDPGNLEIQSRLVELQGRFGNRSEARSRLQALCRHDPLPPEIAYLRARLELAWDPQSDIEPWLRQLPDNRTGPRIGPLVDGGIQDTGAHSKFFLPSRRLRLQVLLRERRLDAAMACLQEIAGEYARGHARHSLFHTQDRHWPPGLYCPPTTVTSIAELYRQAGQPEEGFRYLFGGDELSADLGDKIDSPAVAEAIWRLREASRLLATTPEPARSRADAAWLRTRRLNHDSPRLWRLLGDLRAQQNPPGDSGSAYAESVLLDNRQLDLLRYLPHFSDRFAGGSEVPALNLQAAGADVNPALPVLPGRTRRRVLFLSYLPQGDCLETAVEELRLTRTAADPVAFRADDWVQPVPGRVRDLRSWLEIATGTGFVTTTASLQIGLQSQAGGQVVTLGLPLPETVADRSTWVCQRVSRRLIPRFESEYPCAVQVGPSAGEGWLDESIRIYAAVPANLTETVGSLPLPESLALPADNLLHGARISEYGPLGVGGRVHEWRINQPPAPAPEPDAPDTANRAAQFALGRAPSVAEIARYRRMPDRFRAGVTREIQAEAERIKRLAGIGQLRMLERLRQAVIEYVPVDRPELPVSAETVLRTGLGSRAVLFLALARAMQLQGFTVVACYPAPSPAATPTVDGLSPALWLTQSAGLGGPTLKMMVAVSDETGETRIFDLSDHAPGDGPGVWSPPEDTDPAAPEALRARRTRTQAAPLYRGGSAIVTATPSSSARLLALPPSWRVTNQGDKDDSGPMHDLFEVNLTIDADGKAEMAVAGSWNGPAAQQILQRIQPGPRREFDSESIWKAMQSDFPLSARLPGSAIRLPGWYLLSPTSQPVNGGLARLTASEPADWVGGPAYNTFTVECSLDGTAYAAAQPDGQLQCYLPLRRLELVTRWAALNERRQPLQFTEWRMAREFVQIRAVGRRAEGDLPAPLHFEFAPLVSYDLEITTGARQRWDATRTLRLQPGIVTPEDYPRFKAVLEQIAAADRTTVAFSAAP